MSEAPFSVVHSVDPRTKKSVVRRVPLSADAIAQRAKDEAEHAARMAAPKPPSLAERVAALETAIAALARAPVK